MEMDGRAGKGKRDRAVDAKERWSDRGMEE